MLGVTHVKVAAIQVLLQRGKNKTKKRKEKEKHDNISLLTVMDCDRQLMLQGMFAAFYYQI